MFGKQTIAVNWGRSGMRAALAVGSAVILLAFMCGSAARADDEALLREVLAAAEGHEQAGWAYTSVMYVEAGAVGEREKVTVTEKFDPSKPPGEQLERVEIREDEDGKITTEYDNDKDMDVDVERVVYADLVEIDFESADLVSDSDDEAVYRLNLKEGDEFEFGSAHFGGDSLMDHVFGELVIHKSGPAAPYVSEVRVINTGKGGGFWAEIERLDIRYRFAPSPDGSTYLSHGLNLDLELEVLIFIDIDVDIESSYSDYEYVGEYGS